MRFWMEKGWGLLGGFLAGRDGFFPNGKCQNDSVESHSPKSMWDDGAKEFSRISLSLSAPLSLLWQKSHFFGLFGPWVGLRGPKTNLGAMGHLN